MRICLLLISMMLLQTTMWSQNITISGKVIDVVTNEPLQFAAVGVKGKSMGTITNLQGEFDFHIPSEYRNEILVVSMLGYKNFEAPVWTMLDDANLLIKMDNSITILNEVVVVDSLQAGDIMRIALLRIEKNFPMKPFMLDGFYRDIKKVGGTNISLLEAAVKIFDEDYAEPRNKLKLRERVHLVEVRKSLGYENKFTDYFDQGNLLKDLLLHNSIRYRQIEISDEGLFAGFTRQRNSYYNNHEIYVLTYTKQNHLTVFIDKNNFSIVHMEYDDKSSNDLIDKKNNLISRVSGLHKVLDFKRFEGVMYLNYMSMTSKVNWYDAQTKELKFEAELFQQLLINEVHPKTKNQINENQKMRSYGLQHQNLPYNKKFWENYNVIKDTPLDKKILSDLEKKAPLEKQFEQN